MRSSILKLNQNKSYLFPSAIFAFIFFAYFFVFGVHAFAKNDMIILENPVAKVNFELSSFLKGKVKIVDSLLIFNIRYPKAEVVSDSSAIENGVPRVILQPIANKTRTEFMVDNALPAPVSGLESREWLEKINPDGSKTYKWRSTSGSEVETLVFLADDGVLVGVKFGETTAKVSRRYKGRIEVSYQYQKELPIKEIDKFVVKFLDQNVFIQGG